MSVSQSRSEGDLKDRLATIEDPVRKEAFAKAVGLLGGDSPTRAHMEEAASLAEGAARFAENAHTGFFNNPLSRGDNPPGVDSILTKGKIGLDKDGKPALLDEDGRMHISIDGETFNVGREDLGDSAFNAMGRFFLNKAKDQLAEKPRGL